MGIKRDYILTGIGCGNCARKIEDGIQKLEGVIAVSLNFALLKLSVEVSDTISIAKVEKQIQQVMSTIEYGSKLILPQEAEPSLVLKGDKEKGSVLSKRRMIIYFIGIISYFIGFFFVTDSTLKLLLFIVTYGIFGYGVLLKSFHNILKGKVFDENFLMSVASIGAFVIGEYPEAAAVMMFYQIGEMFQDYAVDHSRKSIKSLLNIKPDYANLKTSEGYQRVNPSQVLVGESIVIRPGERVPLDGIVLEGVSALDTSALTGEPLPKEVSEGSEILSGSINQSGVLVVKVNKIFGDSTVSRILSLVENASQKKAVTERFISRFAAWYTPIVVGFAVLLALIPPLLFNGEFNEWLYRALVFLVLSCPCALVISIPLGFFGGIGAASKRGILVKGGNYLEVLAKVGTVVFDKTGTLTKGTFEVTAVNRTAQLSKNELLYYIAHAEAYSSHPLAVSISKAYGQDLDKNAVSEYREHAGMGVSAKVSGKSVLCGNSKLFDQFNIKINEAPSIGTLIHLALDGNYSGSVQLEDTIKPSSPKAIETLHNLGLGLDAIILLTGDQKDAARAIADKLSIKIVHAELLPHEKVEHLETIMSKRKKSGAVVFVGDGINDAPVIARADVGVAMGGAGSDAAIEAADIVIMTDEPGKLGEAILIAKKTMNVVFQNIFLAVAVKVLVLVLGAGGVATLWEAVFADVGVALLAILNAMRLTRRH